MGPDFFGYFMPAESTLTQSGTLFSDTLHPNGLGYQVMAAIWHKNLEPASGIPLSFILEALRSSAGFEPRQDLVEVGDLYRLNTSHRITSIPAQLNGGRWINTQNSTTNSLTNYLTFTADRPVSVYVAYDGGASRRPNWMNGFSNTGLKIVLRWRRPCNSGYPPSFMRKYLKPRIVEERLAANR